MSPHGGLVGEGEGMADRSPHHVWQSAAPAETGHVCGRPGQVVHYVGGRTTCYLTRVSGNMTCVAFDRPACSPLYILIFLAAPNTRFGGARTQCFPFPGFRRDFCDCFDSENLWDGIVVLVGF